MKWILVADDDNYILEALCHILTEEGYRAIMASSGLAAEKEIKQRIFDLIILDIRLGDRSGAEIAKTVKTDHILRAIPVVLISANLDGKQISERVGADGFLEKPFSREMLAREIRKYVD